MIMHDHVLIHDKVAFRGLPTFFSPDFVPFFPDLARSGVLADAGTPRPVSGQNVQKKKSGKTSNLA